MNTSTLFDKVIDVEIKYTQDEELLNKQTLTAKDVAPKSKLQSIVNSVRKKSIVKSLYITCPEHGKKPEIYFEWKRVPEEICYQCSLKITNLYLNVEVARVHEITITAGYSSDLGTHKCTFNGSVFNSYTPSPGPDGYTVFDMLVAKADANLFSRMYTFTLYNNESKHTVREVLDKVCQKMIGTTFVSRLSSQLLDDTFSEESMDITGKTGYALLNEIQIILNNKVSSHGHFVKTMLFDKSIIFAEFDKEGKCSVQEDVKASRDVTILRLISSADWNAGTLSITAPWVPEIAPGSLFKCYPQYFQGSAALPNEVAIQQLQRDSQDTYYVITQTVKFSTTEENEMTIMAVPLSNSPVVGENLTLSKEASNLTVSTAQMLSAAEQRESNKQVIPIVIEEKPVDMKVKSLKDISLTLAGGRAYKVKAGENLSVIAERYPQLKARRNADYPVATFKASICWFPVIMCLTNTAMKDTIKSRAVNYYIDMSNPENIKTDYYVEEPGGITWKQIADNAKAKADVVNCMREAAKYYKNELVSKASLAGELESAANALENWVVQE